jgi:hypothetical protein
MTDIEILVEMLKNDATIAIETESDKRVVKLTESQINQHVKIYNIPENAIVIKADAFPSPNAIFANSKFECKRADFIIVVETEKVIIYIELKNSIKTKSQEFIIQQLQGAQCLMSYCQSIGEIFWKEKNFLKNYQHRFVNILIKGISVSKSLTNSKFLQIHDHPDRMLQISGLSEISLDYLIGKYPNK